MIYEYEYYGKIFHKLKYYFINASVCKILFKKRPRTTKCSLLTLLVSDLLSCVISAMAPGVLIGLKLN